MRLIGIAAAISLFLSACAAQQSAPEMDDYSSSVRVSPVMPPWLDALQVDLKFSGSASGETRLSMPDSWGPEENLGALVSDLVVRSATGDELTVLRDGSDMTITHAPGQALSVSYTVKQDYDGEPAWGAQRVPGMRPVLQTGFATVIGHTVLQSFGSADVADDLFNVFLPSGAANDLAIFSQPTEDGQTQSLPLDRIRDGIFLIGDFRYA